MIDQDLRKDEQSTLEAIQMNRTLTASQLQLIDRAVAVISGISRTFNGISDTSVSLQKKKLLVEGADLERTVERNFRESLTFLLLNCGDLRLSNNDEAESFVVMMAKKLNRDLQPEDQEIWRSWPSVFGHPDPTEIKACMRKDFYPEFIRYLNSSETDPVEFSAFIEQRFNGKIHPLSDGCGRWSKCMAAAVLGEAGISYPNFNSREEYFIQINLPFPKWLEYYRSKLLV